MASCTTYLAFHFLCLFVFESMIVLTDLPRLFPGPTYEVNYTIAEETAAPFVLGNLIMDFGLTEWMLKQTVITSPDKHRNLTTSPLSIDVIANAGQIRSATLIEPATPKLRLFPSNQWGSKYFSVHYKSVLIQELILTESLDREVACDLSDQSSSSSASTTSDGCSCSSEVCTLSDPNKKLMCGMTLTIALNLLQPGMTVYVVHISIRDINDHTPRFRFSSPFEVSFKESDLPGSKRELPSAVDSDFCDNGKVKYTLISAGFQGPVNSIPFHIQEIPRSHNRTQIELVLQRTLDRELMGSYDLFLLASDQSETEPRRTGTLNLRVVVEDVNDCRPMFDLGEMNERRGTCVPITESYRPTMHIRVPENKGPVPWLLKRLTAYDADIEENGEVHFQFSTRTHPMTRGYFHLNSTTGELLVVELLDREKTPMQDGLHKLIVLAMDSGTPVRSSQLLIIVYLLDVNDNAPRIRLIGENPQLTRNMSQLNQMNESSQKFWKMQATAPYLRPDELPWPVELSLLGIRAPGQVVATLVASDPDRGSNGTVDCHVGNQWPDAGKESSGQWEGKGWFTISPLLMYNDMSIRSSEIDGKLFQQPTELKNTRKYWNQTQEKAYTLDALRPIDPLVVPQIFVQIVCQDRGPNRLTSERTLHLGVEVTVQRAGLHWQYVLLLYEAIKLNEPECVSVNRLANYTMTQRRIHFNNQSAADLVRGAPALCLSLESMDVVSRDRWNHGRELPVFQVKASFDSRMSRYSTTLKYKLLSEKNTPAVAKMFAVNAESGQISLRFTGQPNREVTNEHYVLRLRALLTVQTPQGSVTESVELIVHVHLVPTANMVQQYVRLKDGSFHLENRSIIYLSIAEKAPIGSTVLPESVFYCAASFQSGCFMELRNFENDNWKQPLRYPTFQTYRLSESDWIGRTGLKGAPYTIISKTPLDRAVQVEYRLRLFVSPSSDFIEPVHARTLIIHIKDISDNQPVLMNPFYPVTHWPPATLLCNVPSPMESPKELGSYIYVADVSLSYQQRKDFEIIRIHVVDHDTVQLSSFTYSLNHVFRCDGVKAVRLKSFKAVELDKTYGILRVASEMTRSSLASYVLQITITDSSGKLTALQTVALIQLHVVDEPPFQRPINDLPDTASKSPIAPIQALRLREATYFSGQGANKTNIWTAGTPSPVSPVMKSQNVFQSEGLTGNPWIQRLALISLLVVLSFVCPTIFFWITFAQRGRIRRWLFGLSAHGTIRDNQTIAPHENIGAPKMKAGTWSGEQFRMIEVQSNPLAMGWNASVGRESCLNVHMEATDLLQCIKDSGNQHRTTIYGDLSGQTSLGYRITEKRNMGDISPSPIVENTWQPPAGSGDQQSSCSMISSSNRSMLSFPRSYLFDTIRQRPSDSCVDLKMFHRVSPVSTGLVYHLLAPDISPRSTCLSRPNSNQLPHLFYQRELSPDVEDHFRATRGCHLACSPTIMDLTGEKSKANDGFFNLTQH
ncbi:hypothetical protein FGIG_00732 [Fasciola gigantica]|uniref:Cadherin domain-containing protein n=1 Tax=Fasciola gigantica TaxID=46835 RepID=A0A504YXN6_FASGI|nr:hypothetical protein FGIG_00732 [Fasciola gigantica]